MSNKQRHTTIVLITFGIFLLVIDTLIVIRFFTYDKSDKVTFSQASSINSEEIINSQISKLENLNNKENALKNTNEIVKTKSTFDSPKTESINPVTEKTIIKPVTTSRSSNTRKKIDNNSENKTSIKNQNNNNTKKTQSKSNVSNVSKSSEESFGTIEIPKTGVNLPILKKVTIHNMEVATCFLYSTGSLNNSGTTIIVGHNYQNGKLFSNNNKLSIGDTIYITTSDGKKVKYTIYEKFITTDDDISYLEKNKTNKPQIALSTCTNNEEKRLVILAK